MQLCVSDKLTTGEPRKTADGYLVLEAKIARTGMYDYAGFEFGRPDKRVLKIYRPEATVFSDASMAAFAHKPITNDHPAQDVGPDNYTQLAKGLTGGEVRRDGEHLIVPLMLTDAATIKAVEGGKRGLSAGYKVEVDMTPGVTDSGEAFDGQMVGVIQANHVAVVDRPRAGTFIGDSFPTHQQEVPLVDTKTIMHDGIPLLVTDAAEAVINKQGAELAALKIDIAAKDSELGTKDAKIAELEAAKPTQADIDALADEKADVVGKARALVGDKLVDTAGKTPAEVRKAAVAIKLGDAAIAGKSDDYIAARFDALADTGTAAEQGKALADAAPKALVDAEADAHAKMIARLNRKAA
jgi:hypothetical protein